MINVNIYRSCFFVIHILIFLLIAESCYSVTRYVKDIIPEASVVPIGVVLDTKSPLGSMVDLCIKMAVSDFYSKHPNYTTMLQIRTKNAQTVLDANFAAVDLLKHEQVEGIIGPQGSTQDIFFSELGNKTHVPIISFTARTAAPENNVDDLFVRTSVDDSIQARALAAICHGFQWQQVVLLYEDTEYGHQFQSHLSNAFRDVEIGLVHLTPIPLSASDDHLSKQLSSLNEQETRVFLLHMSPPLGCRLFNVAKKAGMMSEGSAWIITDSLSNFLSSMDSATRDSMEGVVGVRPYVPSSKDLNDFKERWERNSRMDLNVYGFWAYDTIKALAIAAENTGAVTPRSNLGISSYGPRLVREISRTRFRGLSGYFDLINGSLKPSEFEIMNLIGTGEKRVGFWNPEKGIVRDLRSSSTKGVKKILWPGDSTIKPKGWTIPPTGSLRVAVPWKPGFKQFVNVVIDSATNKMTVTGFSVDIFFSAVKHLDFPINYTFICYNDSTSSNWSYDSMLQEIPQKYDMVVADTTIWAPRASYVDFSLPYFESGVVLVVRNNKPLNIWFFTKPLSWDLWLAILAACIFTGLVIWRLEQPSTRRNDDQLEIAFLVPVVALAFQERGLVERKWSVFVLVCWLLTAFVLMQSYTANLSAILTLDQLKFSLSDDQYFGYHNGSFTREFLIEKLNIRPTRLRAYKSIEEYHDGMRRGSSNGGIDAIFDELPYMKLFINRYHSGYKIIGPTYRTNGLGFAFRIGSPLVAHFSRAILNVTQGPEMASLEQQNFGVGYSSEGAISINTASQGASSLTCRDFAGLFSIVAALTVVAFVCAETDFFNIFRNKFISNTNTIADCAPVHVGDGDGNDENATGAAVGGGGDGSEENIGDGGIAEIEVVEREHNNIDDGQDNVNDLSGREGVGLGPAQN